MGSLGPRPASSWCPWQCLPSLRHPWTVAAYRALLSIAIPCVTPLLSTPIWLASAHRDPVEKCILVVFPVWVQLRLCCQAEAFQISELAHISVLPGIDPVAEGLNTKASCLSKSAGILVVISLLNITMGEGVRSVAEGSLECARREAHP